MSRKQATPTQLNQLEEIKRKARVSQEARLKRTLDRLARQEQESSSNTTAATTCNSHNLDPRRTTCKYYAVRRGRTNNAIYISWALCKNQVLNYPGAEVRSFTTYEAAHDYLGTARQLTESRTGHSHAVGSTYPGLSTTANSSTQTTRDRGIWSYLEGVALGIIIEAVIILWTLQHQ
jgi:hypothetical protein